MDTGISKEQLEKIKSVCVSLTKDAQKLKILVLFLVFAIGFFGMLRPLAQRVDAATKGLKKAKTRAELADEIEFMSRQVERLLPRLPKKEVIGDWQEYIVQKCRAAGVLVRELEPKKSVSRKPYKIITLDVKGQGQFPNIVDLLDRLERGDRMVRIDRLFLTKYNAFLSFSFQVKGLVKPRG